MSTTWCCRAWSFGYVLRSPYAHARIRSIDTSAAKAAPGVLAVLTGADWEASGWGDLPVPARPALARRHAGVSAALPGIGQGPGALGRRLCRLCRRLDPPPGRGRRRTDRGRLRAIAGDRLDRGAPSNRTRRWCGKKRRGNVAFFHTEGDAAKTEAAIAGAAHVVRRRLVVNRVTAAAMEPRGAIGDYNPAADNYTIYTTLQRIHSYRAELATQMMKVPESHVRVVAGDIGGSFGMKSAIYNEVPLVLLASKLVGRPVKWTSTRSEAFLGDAQARDNVSDAELALDADGHFLGFRVRTISAVGAYPQTGSNAFVANLGTLAGVYRTPAVRAEVTAVYTNTNPVRPYRGNGRPEFAYIIERMVDYAADELGIDPVELRHRNMIPPEAMPFKSGLTFTYDCGEFAKNLDMALRLAGADGFERRRAEARARGRLRGLGISNTIERAAAGGFEAAEVRFDRSGTVTLVSGSITQGQGHETVYKQLLCDRLGIDPEHVHYVQGDTDKVANGEGTGGSRSAALGGSAVYLATEKIVTKAKALAAHLLGADAGEVKFEDGFFTAPRSNRALTIADVAVESFNPPSLPDGMEPGLIAAAAFTPKQQNFPNGSHICELEIDPDTGEVEILRYSVVDDVGTVMNPLLLHGQICGGVVQGIGQLLMEDIRFDPASGQMLTGSFMDYAMPRAADLCGFDIDSNPVPTKTNPLGVKGAGEAGAVGAMPAVANALVDALSPLGIRHVEMPATPERLWRAIRAAREFS